MHNRQKNEVGQEFLAKRQWEDSQVHWVSDMLRGDGEAFTKPVGE